MRLRLRDAPRAAVDVVARQFGATPGPATGDADLTFAWVDRVGGRGLRLIGRGEAAWDDDGFYLLSGPEPRAGRMELPFDRLGPGCELRIETSMTRPPLLVHLVNVILLARGTCVLHASAASIDGRGMAAPGWSKGGKTEALLAMLDRGAGLIADEWTYIDPATRRMTGSPGPIRLEDWHLDELPSLGALVTPGARRRVRMARAAQALYGRTRGQIRRVPGGRYVDRAARLLDDERHADVPAAGLGTRPDEPVTLDRVAWMVASSEPGISIVPAAAAEIAARMVFSHQHHREALVAAYLQFRFAFPDRPSELLDTLEARERDLLSQVLTSEIPAIEVNHGARPSIRDLGRELVRFGGGNPS